MNAAPMLNSQVTARPMTPLQGFMASSAPALRVAFSTKRKAMDLPSGDQASSSILPVRWVSCFDSPVLFDQRKI